MLVVTVPLGEDCTGAAGTDGPGAFTLNTSPSLQALSPMALADFTYQPQVVPPGNVTFGVYEQVFQGGPHAQR